LIKGGTIMAAKTRTSLACAVLILALAAGQTPGATLRVDPNDPNAYSGIQEAIDAAWDFDTIVVNPGSYHEHINFFGKAVSVASSDPNDPNVVAATVLDGDGEGNVVTFNNAETPFSVLDGFAITNGNVGIYCEGGNTQPVIRKCIIRANATGIEGPYTNPATIEAHASPTIIQSIVEENSKAGILNCGGEARDCLIADNGEHGIHNCWGQVVRSVIRGNAGHGAYNQGRAPGSLVNCIVSGNKGCGVSCDEVYTSWLVRNCTVVGNGSDGIFMGDGTAGTVINSVIVQNSGWGLSGYRATATVEYNNVYGNKLGSYWYVDPGTHDIHEKPWFAGQSFWNTDGTWHEGDYHLRSTVGRWDPVAKAWVTDPVDSPCIDAGDPSSPFDGEPYPNGGRVNLGAYGGTAEASKSLGGPKCVEYPEMDFNHDCKVDQADLDIFLQHWLECGLDDPDACWPDGVPAAPVIPGVQP
jgi:hypothetical protein